MNTISRKSYLIKLGICFLTLFVTQTHAQDIDSYINYLYSASRGRLSQQGAQFLRQNWVRHVEPCVSMRHTGGGWLWIAQYQDGFRVGNVCRICRGTYELATYFLGISDGDCDAAFIDANGNEQHVCFPRDAAMLVYYHGPIVAIWRDSFVR
jgi:hypothetical protein